jgi:hypothetical protein
MRAEHRTRVADRASWQARQERCHQERYAAPASDGLRILTPRLRPDPFCSQVGPHICVFKTHVDVFDTWTEDHARKLRELADKHGEPGQGLALPLPWAQPRRGALACACSGPRCASHISAH